MDNISALDALNNIELNPVIPFDSEKAKDYYKRISHTSLDLFRTCPRKWQLLRFSQREPNNIHFIFGHAVGDGIAAIASGVPLDVVIFTEFLKFSVGPLYEDPKNKKSWAMAVEALRSFKMLWDEQLSLEWEVCSIDGKPVAELGLSVTIDAYTYRGFVDLVLRNKYTGEVAVLENKTTGARSCVEAMYGNSNQSLGYAVILDKIVPDVSSYLVLHTVFTTMNLKWNLFPVRKTLVNRANWLRDLLFTVRQIEMYSEDDQFPMFGSGCVAYGKQCHFYGICDQPTAEIVGTMPVLEDEPQGKYHYRFTIQELIDQQLEIIG